MQRVIYKTLLLNADSFRFQDNSSSDTVLKTHALGVSAIHKYFMVQLQLLKRQKREHFYAIVLKAPVNTDCLCKYLYTMTRSCLWYINVIAPLPL